jgi:hypothetical protein
MPTVNCPMTISSPAPDERFLAMGGKANMVCGLECHVTSGEAGQLGQFRCPLGHQFFALIPTTESESSDDPRT